jgi:hypothetical protein
MKHKHLLKNITLIIICTCATTLLSIAQKKTMGSPSKVDSLSYNDSLVKSRVNLPLNITVSPNSTTASTQAVYTPDLIKQPVTNVLNALTGQLAGLYSLQSSGQPMRYH